MAVEVDGVGDGVDYGCPKGADEIVGGDVVVGGGGVGVAEESGRRQVSIAASGQSTVGKRRRSYLGCG